MSSQAEWAGVLAIFSNSVRRVYTSKNFYHTHNTQTHKHKISLLSLSEHLTSIIVLTSAWLTFPPVANDLKQLLLYTSCTSDTSITCSQKRFNLFSKHLMKGIQHLSECSYAKFWIFMSLLTASLHLCQLMFSQIIPNSYHTSSVVWRYNILDVTAFS